MNAFRRITFGKGLRDSPVTMAHGGGGRAMHPLIGENLAGVYIPLHQPSGPHDDRRAAEKQLTNP